MRFVVAVLAAFFILMLDLDALPHRALPHRALPEASPYTPALRISSVFDIDLAGRHVLESASASEEPAATMEPDEAVDEETRVSAQEEFCRVLKAAAEESGIPLPFFARLIWQESRFRADEVSHAGAQGVAQFMPDTAAEVGLDDPFDPIKALPASARLLGRLREQFGNLGLAAAAYNAGSARIQKWLAKESPLPRETRDYVRIITGTAAESWTDQAQTASMRLDLPREAPCEGFGGLSKTKDFALVSVSLTPGVSTIIRKAEAAEALAKAAADRTRKRVAMLSKLRKTMLASGARSARRTALAARASAKGPQRSRAFRIASAAR